MALPVGQERMDAEFVIDPAQGGIAEVFAQVIADREPVRVVESEVDRGLLFLFFFIEFRHTLRKISNRVIVLFFQFIQPADRFHRFLAGTLFGFVIISINDGKPDTAMGVRCFFKIHSKHSISYNTYYTIKRYKTLVKYD